VTKPMQMIALAAMFSLTLGSAARGQDKPTVTSPPLKVQVVIARYQGDKKVSSLPYTLSLSTNRPGANMGASLRMGSRIPVKMIAGQPKEIDGKPAVQVGPVQYQDVGTNMDCQATALEDGRFLIQITVDDTSVYPDDKTVPGDVSGNPSFRSFKAVDSMVLKDGQSAQFTTGTDKITGETVRVDVTLTVVK
jgi:hypothetical protein